MNFPLGTLTLFLLLAESVSHAFPVSRECLMGMESYVTQGDSVAQLSVLPVRLDASGVEADISVLLFRGDPIDLEAIENLRPLADALALALMLGRISVHYNEATGVGALVCLSGTAHQTLVTLLDATHVVLGGTRYVRGGERINSTHYKNLPGPQVQDANFALEFDGLRRR